MSKRFTTFLISILLVLAFSNIIYAQYWTESMESGEGSYSYYTDEDPRFPDWYEVSDAERTFCSTTGPTAEVESYYSVSGISAAEFPVSKLTMTLQGEKTEAPDKTLYEIAWYVHPLAEDITYTIELIDEDGDEEELDTGFATALEGDADYKAFEVEVGEPVYESVQIVLEDGSIPLTVSIVEKTE